MKAAFYEKKGLATDVLLIGDIPTPEPGFGEVKVKVFVSAINPSDTKTREGWGGNTEMPYPCIIPHNDGAGRIESVGVGVPQERIGERVWIFEAQLNGRAFGTAAEYVVIPSENAVRLPDNASFDDGASLGVPGMTAHRLLFADGAIHGKRILVQGGAGSVGHLAVQLAHWAGAQVIATVSSDSQAEIAKACGASLVLNYKTDDVAREICNFTGKENSIDRIVEVAFVKNLDLDARVLAPNGIISTYAIDEDPSHPPAVNLQQLVPKDVTVHFTLVYSMPKAAHEAAALDLNAAIEVGALKPRIAKRFALDEIIKAHELLGTGGAGGKVLIDIK